MNSRKIIERILNINPKLALKYKKNPDRWWSVPEENFLIPEFGIRMYMGVSIISWIISAICILSTLLSRFSNQETLFTYSVVGSCLFAILGFVILNSSNHQKKDFEKEKQKFEHAKVEKLNSERRMTTYFRSACRNLSDKLEIEVKKDKEIEELDYILDDLLVLVHDAESVLNEIYKTSKVYQYNVNEPLEIEAYSTVDSYKTYESLSSQLNVYLRNIYDAKRYIEASDSKNLMLVLENIILSSPEELNEYEENELLDIQNKLN